MPDHDARITLPGRLMIVPGPRGEEHSPARRYPKLLEAPGNPRFCGVPTPERDDLVRPDGGHGRAGGP